MVAVSGRGGQGDDSAFLAGGGSGGSGAAAFCCDGDRINRVLLEDRLDLDRLVTNGELVVFNGHIAGDDLPSLEVVAVGGRGGQGDNGAFLAGGGSGGSGAAAFRGDGDGVRFGSRGLGDRDAVGKECLLPLFVGNHQREIERNDIAVRQFQLVAAVRDLRPAVAFHCSDQCICIAPYVPVVRQSPDRTAKSRTGDLRINAISVSVRYEQSVEVLREQYLQFLGDIGVIHVVGRVGRGCCIEGVSRVSTIQLTVNTEAVVSVGKQYVRESVSCCCVRFTQRRSSHRQQQQPDQQQTNPLHLLYASLRMFLRCNLQHIHGYRKRS